MDILSCAAGLLLVGDILGPDSRITKVEPLVRSESVDQAGILAGDGVMHSGVGDAESAMVSDILSEGELTVSHKSGLAVFGGQNLNRAELVRKNLCLRLELGVIISCPPPGHVTLAVKQTTLVVETMGHLVTDHDTDATIVDSVVSIRVEERRLENSGREADLVGAWIVISVDSLRRHSPLGPVGGFAKFRKPDNRS